MFNETGGDGAKLLVASPDVPVISFTGSTQTGIAILRSASTELKRVGLELGGKLPIVLFEDADLDAALPVIEKALTTFGGQFCITAGRLLVHSSIAELVRAKLADRLAAVRTGPSADVSSGMGPLIDQASVERVDGMVRRAIGAGAEVILRGGRVLEGPLAKGAFYLPTFLEVTDSKLEIMQEEVFGPVIAMLRFDTEDEAIALANDSRFGLAASIWTRDVDRSFRVARQIDSGIVWVNDWAALYDDVEEGGFKQSGSGRLSGLSAMDDFLEIKHISLTSPRAKAA